MLALLPLLSALRMGHLIPDRADRAKINTPISKYDSLYD